MASPKKPKLRIAICGGGIAGLSAAAFLSKSPDIELHVLEAKSEIRAIGAGIAIWKRYWDILEDMIDLGSECNVLGLKLSRWSEVKGPVLRKADKPSCGMDFANLPLGPRILPRDALLHILHKSLDNVRCHVQTNKKLVSWEQHGSENVIVYFEDGMSMAVDLLIGADGVHSLVRPRLFQGNPIFSKPEFSGQFAYRMTCPIAEIEKLKSDHEALRGFKIWCGDGRHVTSSAVRDDIHVTAYNNIFDEKGLPIPLALGEPWVAEVPAAEIAKLYEGWESDLVSLLGVPKVASRWAIHIVQHLPTFVADRVCLIGDAAHGMTPHVGLGANSGIEDAYILARLLAHPRTTTSNLSGVLAIYDSIRRPVTQRVAQQSLAYGLTYASLDLVHGEASLKALGDEIIASSRWIIQGDRPETDWVKAQSMLLALPSSVTTVAN